MMAVTYSFCAEIFIVLNVNHFSVRFFFWFVCFQFCLFDKSAKFAVSVLLMCGGEQSCCELRFVIICCETRVNWVVCVFKCSHGWIKMGWGCTEFIRSKPVNVSHLSWICCVRFLLNEVNVVVFVSIPGELWVFAIFAPYVKASL